LRSCSKVARTGLALAVPLALVACSGSNRDRADTSTIALPMADRMAKAAGCMQSNGLDAVVNDGGVVLRTAPPKGVPFQDIMQACLKEAGADEQRPALTDAQLVKVYEYWSEMAVCLTKLGYPPAPAPSLDTFIGDYRAGTVWDPWGNVPANEFTRATSQCPQAVPGVSD